MNANGDEQAGCRVLLIDLDNCPKHVANLVQELQRFSRILCFYGSVEPKLPLSLVRELATAIHEGMLEFVGTTQSGKNAADFALAYYAGRLAAELPEETEFVVLSHDSDLDHVVAMLRREHREARRVGPTDLDLAQAVQQYYESRLQGSMHRPVRRRTLLNSINAFFKGTGNVSCEQVLDGLIQRGVVSFDEQDQATYEMTASDTERLDTIADVGFAG